MSEETPKELIERIGYNEFYRYYMEKQYYIKILQEKIDKAIEYINDIPALIWNEAHKFDYDFEKLLEILGDKENE